MHPAGRTFCRPSFYALRGNGEGDKKLEVEGVNRSKEDCCAVRAFFHLVRPGKVEKKWHNPSNIEQRLLCGTWFDGDQSRDDPSVGVGGPAPHRVLPLPAAGSAEAVTGEGKNVQRAVVKAPEAKR